jgi:hypothetical protein
MATEFYMDNYTKQFQTTPPVLVPAAQGAAVPRFISDQITTTADHDNADVVVVSRPPKGWRWHGLSAINHGALGTGVTIALGTGVTGAGAAADPTKFLAATAAATAGEKKCNVAAGLGYEFDGQTDVILTYGGADCDASILVAAELVFSATH